jgi:hypothetical protein
MRLSNEIEVQVGDDGRIVLRQPTNKEWNEFTAARFPMKRGGQRMVDKSHIARVDLFDLIVVKIDNIEDGAGPITVDTKDRLPDWIKQDVIFRAFELREDIEVKN